MVWSKMLVWPLHDAKAKKVILGNFSSPARNTLKLPFFEMDVASLKSVQLLKTRWVLETRGSQLFKYDIRF